MDIDAVDGGAIRKEKRVRSSIWRWRTEARRSSDVRMKSRRTRERIHLHFYPSLLLLLCSSDWDDSLKQNEEREGCYYTGDTPSFPRHKERVRFDSWAECIYNPTERQLAYGDILNYFFVEVPLLDRAVSAELQCLKFS